MAYDASFLTGSDERAVDPISTAYHHNDQEIGDLASQHTELVLADDKLNLSLESFNQMGDIKLELDNNVRRGVILSQTMYRILNTELKNASKHTKAGFDNFPAMESFNRQHPRDLTFAMENIVTDFISEMWTKIKNAFISLHNTIKTWYIKAFDGAARLKKQAVALKAKADGMSASVAKEASFEMGGVKFLNFGGKVASAQDIGKGVAEIAKISNGLLTVNPQTYTDLFPKLEKVLQATINQAKEMKGSDGTPEKEGTPPKPEGIADAFNGNLDKSAKGTESLDAAGNKTVMSGETNKLLSEITAKWSEACKVAGIAIDQTSAIDGDPRFEGGKVFAYRNPTDLLGSIMLVAVFPVEPKAIAVDSYSDFKSGFKISPEPITSPPKEIEDQGTFQTAAPALVLNICENVMQTCDTFLNYRLLYEARDKATGNLMKQMEQYVSSNSTLKGPGQKHISNSIQATVACMKKMNDGETRWSKYAMSVLNKAIVYCRNSLNQY